MTTLSCTTSQTALAGGQRVTSFDLIYNFNLDVELNTEMPTARSPQQLCQQPHLPTLDCTYETW